MKFLFVLSIVLVTSLPTYGSMRRSLTPAREGRNLADLRLPPNLRSRDVPKFRIPNSELCAQLNLDPGRLYLVLPWWYQYCQDHKERKAKKYSAVLPNLDYYMDKLKRVNYARKMAKQQMARKQINNL
ncbi:uncharacterized protein LOC114362931 [Ostrinia furnacalis]|uniref:uncharacterized protein LOC114362931 n=1 Tax=Ostrinia furnacalis TaxID=93504 RepID=UPI00103EFD5C|nr:uncharacterized protein LOC114362931 [Ostrinia furnacalis]